MKRLSLTARMSLMFMLAVTLVLTLAGLGFHQLSLRHFQVLDQQILEEKLASTRRILGKATDTSDMVALEPQLRALFGAHRDLTAIILGEGGVVLFADPASIEVPEPFRDHAQKDIWQWQADGHRYRGLSAEVALAGQSAPLRVLLVLDVTQHLRFFDTLERWFAGGLPLSALISFGLGWAVARSGLRPLRQVTQLATAISAKSLKERIRLTSIPSELQQLVSAFNAMLARLEDAFVRLSNFSADIAHELRTPLSNLMTHTEVILSRPRDSATYVDNLAENLEELHRMSRMIDDMLFLAKSDNGLIIPAHEQIALDAVVEQLFDYYRPLAEDRQIALHCSGAGQVRGDALMLRRAIANLLSNALRYTLAGQAITVNIEQRDQVIFLSVKNPGASIPVEHLERLFDRFYRADPARREGSPSNAGLGLAITRSIIDAHHGTISCRSANGWTVFQIEFS